VIRAGAHTEAEMKSRKEAFDDAIHAARAAVAEGVVPGGGLALVRAAEALKELERNCTGDELTGVRILARSLEAPARQIVENSGGDAGVVIARMRAESDTQGFDAASGEFTDLIEAGILDPTKVVRVALENAVSIASVLLLAEGTLTQVEERRRRGENELEEPEG
jgi:chaperonin GroEL